MRTWIADGRGVCRARAARGVLVLAVMALWAAAPVAAARATTILAIDFDTQCAAADRIFVGEVTSVESRRNQAAPRYFQTIVTFAVETVIAGNVPSTVELRFAGGTIGDEQQSIDGMHEFTAGERYVVFTDPDADRPLIRGGAPRRPHGVPALGPPPQPHLPVHARDPHLLVRDLRGAPEGDRGPFSEEGPRGGEGLLRARGVRQGRDDLPAGARGVRGCP